MNKIMTNKVAESSKFSAATIPETGRASQKTTSLMTMFDEKNSYWKNAKKVPNRLQRDENEKILSTGRALAVKSDLQSLPKLRQRVKQPEQQLRSMNKEVKREIIAKFRDKLEVTQFRPDPTGIKQVDEDQQVFAQHDDSDVLFDDVP